MVRNVLIVVIIFMLSCVGDSRTEMLNESSDEDVANEKLIKIIDCIKNMDEESQKLCFLNVH